VNIYWRSPRGPLPPNAQFSCYPFFGPQKPFRQKLITTLPPPAPLRVTRQTFFPPKKAWIQKVEKILLLIQKKEVEKVVLARTTILELAEAPDPLAVTAMLQSRSEGAYLFCFSDETQAFLGASPERLFIRQGNEIQSDALAGTRRRGKDPSEDALLKQELLNHPKELSEFTFVKKYLEKTLEPLSLTAPSFSPTSIHQTQNVQHLHAVCSTTLKNSLSDETILRTLHPTPALCGVPKEKALSLIQELEPFDRGLYGGILGWSTPEASEWIVAIRSCLLQQNRATLYSGVGIVEGSDPEKEWDELNHKLNIYI
jgi:menaquinone-specific isochorismate synthase